MTREIASQLSVEGNKEIEPQVAALVIKTGTYGFALS